MTSNITKSIEGDYVLEFWNDTKSVSIYFEKDGIEYYFSDHEKPNTLDNIEEGTIDKATDWIKILKRVEGKGK